MRSPVCTMTCFSDWPVDENHYVTAYHRILLAEQHKYYEEEFQYFNCKNKVLANIPPLISKFNLFIDSKSGLIRVKSKLNYIEEKQFPILLPKESMLTKLIIDSTHRNLSHSGIYSVIKELKNKFWIVNHFSLIRNVLRNCITCSRFHKRTLKVNQNEYRDFRITPNTKPFSNVFLDYIGPFTVKRENKNCKVWLLIITCLFTRAVNLVVCDSCDTNTFLKALQMHIFQYGMFSECRADLGSQITAGFNILRTFLSDFDTLNFFETHCIEKPKMEQFCKGNSALGSVVESLVKQTKLIQKSVRNNILNSFDFKFLIEKVVHLINRRPIAFKEGLRCDSEIVPDAITPEMLLHGYELVSLNIIPELQVDDNDRDWSYDNKSKVKSCFSKLQKIRNRLIEEYHSEFMRNLIQQSLDKRDRYKPVKHQSLKLAILCY